MYSMLDPIRLWYGLLARVGIILATSPLLWTIDSVVKIEHRNLQRVAMTLKIVKGG
jgi:prolipoprotein diacylglyceryltransferase